MNKIYWIGTVLIGALVVTAGIALSDEDDGFRRRTGTTAAAPDPDPAAHELYVRECGSCHFAYPANLLPSTSWNRIMNGLSDHFGDNAELANEDRQLITNFLRTRAADRSGARRSAKIVRSLTGREPPIRITEIPYIRRKHLEIPSRMISGNPEVRSLSHCNACHNGAGRGSFDEDAVSIPNYGRWDD